MRVVVVVVVACPVAWGATVAALAAAPEAMAATATVLPATVSVESLRLDVLLLDNHDPSVVHVVCAASTHGHMPAASGSGG